MGGCDYCQSSYRMQEVDKLQAKLNEAKDGEERKMISRELEITETKRELAVLR